MSKPSLRRLVSCIAAMALLLAQLAAAAHACSGTAPLDTAATAGGAQPMPCAHCKHAGAMPDRDGVDDCLLHCQVGAQAVAQRFDPAAAATVPAAAPAPAVLVWPTRPSIGLRYAARPRGSGPPARSLYLVHCSLRT